MKGLHSSPFNDYLPLLFASLPPTASLTPSATSAAASPTPSTTSPAASPTSLTASPAALPALSTSFETLLLSFLFSLFVFTVDSGDGEKGLCDLGYRRGQCAGNV